jgi:flagellar biosynthesis anti-sigma factor FlgM
MSDDKTNKTSAAPPSKAASSLPSVVDGVSRKSKLTDTETADTESGDLPVPSHGQTEFVHIDWEKVAQVKAALASGSFQVDPEQIAEQMIENAKALLKKTSAQ